MSKLHELEDGDMIDPADSSRSVSRREFLGIGATAAAVTLFFGGRLGLREAEVRLAQRYERRILEGTVMIRLRSLGGKRAGFIADPYSIVTAAHCITGYTSSDIGYISTVQVDARGKKQVKTAWTKCYDQKEPVLVEHPKLDLAVLRFPDALFDEDKVLPIASGRETIFFPVIAAGHPLEYEWIVSFGSVNLRSGFDGEYNLSLPVDPGNSGGPLMNGDGEVIGVIVKTDMRGTNTSFAVPIDPITIQQLITQARIQQQNDSSVLVGKERALEEAEARSKNMENVWRERRRHP